MTTRVDVWRGDVIESRHAVSVAVADGAGRIVAGAGDKSRVVYARSAVKPLQALPLVEDGVMERFGLSDDHLAVACGSHSGEAVHAAAVREVLERIGLTEDALACGPHAPFDAAARRELRQSGGQPARVHNNCSGKHAGMLALALAHRWPIEGYQRREHPVQQRMLQEMARWSGLRRADLGVAVDGCGVATFALPLDRLAVAFAAFCLAAARGTDERGVQVAAERSPARVVGAMARNPAMVAGTGRMCTRVMEVTRGRVILKVGAEGVYCAGAPATGLAIALKVEDGAKRAAEPALLAVLRRLDLLTDAELDELRAYAEPAIENTRGEPVGRLTSVAELMAVGSDEGAAESLNA